MEREQIRKRLINNIEKLGSDLQDLINYLVRLVLI